MNIIEPTLLLKRFHKCEEIAFYSQYEETDEHWYNTGLINENTLLCLADDLITLELPDVKKISNLEMNQVSWVRWADFQKLIDPTKISNSNVNVPNCPRLNTIGTLVYWEEGGSATLENDFFDMTAKSEFYNGQWCARVKSNKAEQVIPLKIDPNLVRSDLVGFLNDLVRKSRADFNY